MIRVRCRDWQVFLPVFAHARWAGANPTPAGGNEMLLPDDTPRHVLDGLAGRDGITITGPCGPCGAQPAESLAAQPSAQPSSQQQKPATDDTPRGRAAKPAPASRRTPARSDR